MVMTMTERARAHMQQQLDTRGSGMGIRVGVKTAGCSGLSYVFEFVDTLDVEDTAFEQGTFSLVVDTKSLVVLAGTEIDFVKDGLNEGFEFNNPNSKSACGCGESFHV